MGSSFIKLPLFYCVFRPQITILTLSTCKMLVRRPVNATASVPQHVISGETS